jgi:hypothetical protein
MHMTLALTSPGASFDRIRQVAGLYIKTDNIADAKKTGDSLTGSTRIEQPVILPKATKTRVGAEYDLYDNSKFGFRSNGDLAGLFYTGSLGGFHAVGRVPVEALLTARQKLSVYPDATSSLGSSGVELAARIRSDEQAFFGPFIRFTTKSLDDSDSPIPYNYDREFPQAYNLDRDVLTVGSFFTTENHIAYLS